LSLVLHQATTLQLDHVRKSPKYNKIEFRRRSVIEVLMMFLCSSFGCCFLPGRASENGTGCCCQVSLQMRPILHTMVWTDAERASARLKSNFQNRLSNFTAACYKNAAQIGFARNLIVLFSYTATFCARN